MKISLIAILLIQTWMLTFNSAHARDPDVPYEPPHEWGERETVGGSNWSGGDTFIAIALPIAAVMLLTLPHIFDGEHERWPVHKFALFNVIEQQRILYKFPTRSLCGSY